MICSETLHKRGGENGLLLQSVFEKKEEKKMDIISARCKNLTLIKDEVEESTRPCAPALTDRCHFEMVAFQYTLTELDYFWNYRISFYF